jgi:hypothetical protein
VARSLYNVSMANRAYAGIWVRGFSEATMLTHFERFLATVPLAAEPPGFTEMVIRAVDPTETPLEEHDLRTQSFTPEEIVELARGHLSPDISLEVAARWDLWVRDVESVNWVKKPQRLSLHCFGLDYDEGPFAESGHLFADLGLEHLFTGHAGLLAGRRDVVAQPEHPDEARFLRWMSQPENLREYHTKTRENIQKLMDWMRAVETALPVERVRLWSEGEENFEARLDEILAVH